MTPDLPPLTVEGVEGVLDEVRPFLSIAGGSLAVESVQLGDAIQGLGQPVVTLRMSGKAAALRSVKVEIAQRLQRHFENSLRVEWEED